MVKETRHIFDLTDIKAVRLQCNSCKKEFVQSLVDNTIPDYCPSPKCDRRWENAQKTDNYHLLRAARAILFDPTSLPMTIRFEIDGEENKRS